MLNTYFLVGILKIKPSILNKDDWVRSCSHTSFWNLPLPQRTYSHFLPPLSLILKLSFPRTHLNRLVKKKKKSSLALESLLSFSVPPVFERAVYTAVSTLLSPVHSLMCCSRGLLSQSVQHDGTLWSHQGFPVFLIRWKCLFYLTSFRAPGAQVLALSSLHPGTLCPSSWFFFPGLHRCVCLVNIGNPSSALFSCKYAYCFWEISHRRGLNYYPSLFSAWLSSLSFWSVIPNCLLNRKRAGCP